LGLPEWLPAKARVVEAGSLAGALDACGAEGECIALVPGEEIGEAAVKGCRPPGGLVYVAGWASRRGWRAP
jgi:hypothetical protein